MSSNFLIVLFDDNNTFGKQNTANSDFFCFKQKKQVAPFFKFHLSFRNRIMIERKSTRTRDKQENNDSIL